MPGRSREEIRNAANNVSVPKEWEAYVPVHKNRAQRSYSYSFETRVFYDANNPAGRQELTQVYGDGVNPVNMIAMHDVFNKTLAYGDIASDAHRLIERGMVPFIGYWKSPAGFYTGVSMAVNHEASDPDVAKILRQCDQMCAARVFPDRVAFFSQPA